MILREDEKKQAAAGADHEESVVAQSPTMPMLHHGRHGTLHHQYSDLPQSDDVDSLAPEGFLSTLFCSNGPPQVVLLVVIFAFGLGSIISVVPEVMTDRYARLYHGYTAEPHCISYNQEDKPDACFYGSADAQNAVAVQQLVSNGLLFFSSSLIGSLSDEYGRKGLLLLGLFLSALSPLALLLVEINPHMSPNWYYFLGCLQGLCSWIPIAASSLSDVIPPRFRAGTYGIMYAGFALGFTSAPTLTLALKLDHFAVTLVSVGTVCLGFTLILFGFTETLPTEVAARALVVRMEQCKDMEGAKKCFWYTARPISEMSILNRNTLFRLLAALSFFSGIVASGDQTLLVYYLQERLSFDEKDIANMFLLMGVLGIFVQSTLLKMFTDFLGERLVVIISFTAGVIHNLFFGLAGGKTGIMIAAGISPLVNISSPTIAAIKSNNVDESEQGRIQGALFSVQSLASALGPLSMRFVYHFTKDGAFVGAGSMFCFAAFLYLIGVCCAVLLPPEADARFHGKVQQEKASSRASDKQTLV